MGSLAVLSLSRRLTQWGQGWRGLHRARCLGQRGPLGGVGVLFVAAFVARVQHLLPDSIMMWRYERVSAGDAEL
jgi:hypothetical protein